MNKFLVGQIVKVSDRFLYKYSENVNYQMYGTMFNRIQHNSTHVLTLKDIKRGYYFTEVGSFDLDDCEVVNDRYNYYRSCTRASGYDQSLLGAVTRGISIEKAYIFKDKSCHEWISTTIYFKGKLRTTYGFIYDNQIYWINSENGLFYKTKLRTLKNGYIVGRDVCITSKDFESKVVDTYCNVKGDKDDG